MNGSAVGVGLIAGPSLGSAIYKQLGYANTIYTFAGFIAITLVQHLIFVPSSINVVKNRGDDIFDELEKDSEMKSTLTPVTEPVTRHEIMEQL